MFGSYGETIEYNDIGPNNIPRRSGAACNGLKLAGNADISGEGTIARYNYIHDFTNGCIGHGMVANGSGGMIIYSNLIEGIGNGQGMEMVANEHPGDGAWKIYNNTVADIQTGWGIRVSHNEKAGTEIYNNIFDGTAGDFAVSGDGDSVGLEGGYNILVNSGAVVAEGVSGLYDCGTPCTDLGNTDPDFEDEANDKYWVQAGSPAIDAGVYLDASIVKALLPGSVWPSDVVAVDPYMDGTQREIGAYAYTNNAAPVKGEGVFASVKKDGVFIRSGPSTENSIIRSVNSGHPLEILEQNGQWVRINYFRGKQGWIYKPFIGKAKTIVVNVSRANLRKGPNINKDIVAKLDYGSVMNFDGKFGKWLKISNHDGLEGWLYGELAWPEMFESLDESTISPLENKPG
jgi:SH3-like domain-containing protein